MKKLLVFLMICLSSTMMFAQTTHYQTSGVGVSGLTTKFICVLVIDGVEQENSNLEIAAFDAEGICRGAKLPLVNPKTGRYVYQMQLRGTDGVHCYTFKVYDHETETDLDVEANFNFEWNSVTYTEVCHHGNFTMGGAMTPVNADFVSAGPAQETFTKDIVGYADGLDGWYFISSPVVGEVTPTAENGFLTDTCDLYSFDQAFEGQEWRNFKDTEVGGYNLVNGKGYLYASKTDTQLQFTGVPYSGDGVVELEYTEENVAWQGWNLIGNPFTVEAYLEGEYYVMNEDHNGYEPIYDGTVVPAMEAVLIQATEPGQSVTFTTDIPNSKSANLALNLSSNGAVVDRAIVSFDEGRSLPKVQLRETSTKVYIPMDNEDYAVVSAEEMGEMPVSFKAEKNGSYSLNFTAEAVSFNYLHLIDNMTGADVDLLETPSYSFNATTTDYANRFKLVFATGNATGDNFAFFSNGNFIISNEGEATLQVVDVMGRILMSENINGSASVNVNAAPGVYMLRLVNGNDMKVQKVVVE